eukprot:1139419-Pelagomonas_calceolata.AAC.6
MQAAPAMHCILASLTQSAADHVPEAPLSTHWGRGAGPAPHCISKFRAVSSSFAEQLTPSIEHRFDIPLQLKLCKSSDPNVISMHFMLVGAVLGA